MNKVKIILLIAVFLFFAGCGRNEAEVTPPDVSESEVSEGNVQGGGVGQGTQVSPGLSEIPAYVTIGGEEYSTALIELDLSRRELGDGDIQNLRHMVNLIDLNLSGNQISDLTPIAGLLNLTGLTLGENQISDITPLAGLVNLTGLWLSENQITDWSPVDHINVVDGRP